MLYNRCTSIYKFGNNTYTRRIRRRSNLGHFFEEKVRLMGREIRYIHIILETQFGVRCAGWVEDVLYKMRCPSDKKVS